MKPSTLLALIGFLVAPIAQATTNPTSVVTKVFEVKLSVHPDCSSAVTIFKSNNPTPMNFIDNPTLGSGAAPNGTYHCVAIHMSDLITVTPQGDDGANCHAGVPF